MREICSAAIALVPVALLAGCASPSFPKIALLPPAAEQGGSAAGPSQPHETSVVVAGTPTGVFAQVARGVLGCWLGADGPLKASHVYRAEANPPAKGGAAAIVIYERDASQQDGRGSRAYQASFSSEVSGVRVAMTAKKFELKFAQAMARDVEAWAKGNESCQLRNLMPRPAPPAPAKATAKPVRGSGSSKKP